MGFNEGTIVSLKSGGPKMTVRNCKSDLRNTPIDHFPDSVTCVWFDGNGNVNNGVFKETDLKEVR